MSKRCIIIPIMEKYEELLISNIYVLRQTLRCSLPIELWQIGQEISDSMKKKLEAVREPFKLSFKNVSDYTDNPEHWRGWQIKAFVVKYTQYDEIILCDCDSVFLQNPENVFKDQNYINTGTFFFKDFMKHEPNDWDVEIPARKEFIRRLMPEKKKYFPEEWNYIYNLPSTVQSMWFYQESGVVFLNKTMNPDVVETIFELNDNHKETYKYVYGDKETFWLACVINGKPFHMNPIPAENYKANNKLPCVDAEKPNSFVHLYNNTAFFSQKGYPLFQ